MDGGRHADGGRVDLDRIRLVDDANLNGAAFGEENGQVDPADIALSRENVKIRESGNECHVEGKETKG